MDKKKNITPSTQQPERPKTIKEKKEDNLRKIKQLYKIDLINGKFALFMNTTGKKPTPIPGLLYIKGKGFLIGTYIDRGAAMKAQVAKKKNLTVAESHSSAFTYTVLLISDTIRSAVIKEGLRR